MDSSGFKDALERAIALRARKKLVRTVLVFGVGVAVSVGIAAVSAPIQAIQIVVVTIVATVVSFSVDPGMKALTSLRGAEPDIWLASPSHGLVVVTDKSLIVGGVGALALDKNARVRCEGVGYLEDVHALAVQSMRVTQTRDGENESRKTIRVSLEEALPPDQALKLALRLNEMSAR